MAGGGCSEGSPLGGLVAGGGVVLLHGGLRARFGRAWITGLGWWGLRSGFGQGQSPMRGPGRCPLPRPRLEAVWPAGRLLSFGVRFDRSASVPAAAAAASTGLFRWQSSAWVFVLPEGRVGSRVRRAHTLASGGSVSVPRHGPRGGGWRGPAHPGGDESTPPRPSPVGGAPDPRLRRLALSALLQAANDAGGRTADPSIEVSVTASWIFPPAE
jgi:hypothetical protein